jgi:hypothetical protein
MLADSVVDQVAVGILEPGLDARLDLVAGLLAVQALEVLLVVELGAVNPARLAATARAGSYTFDHLLDFDGSATRSWTAGPSCCPACTRSHARSR